MKYLIIFLPALLVLAACQSTPTSEATAQVPSDNANTPAQDQSLEASETITFKISGVNYNFIMEGKTAPELRVKQGQKVRIEFKSDIGFHDWVIDEFNAATDRVRPEDGMTSVEFIADKRGTFEYYCSVGSHRANGMFGNLIVE